MEETDPITKYCVHKKSELHVIVFSEKKTCLPLR